MENHYKFAFSSIVLVMLRKLFSHLDLNFLHATRGRLSIVKVIPVTATLIQGLNHYTKIRKVFKAIESLQPKDKNPGCDRNHNCINGFMILYNQPSYLKSYASI